jgi:hypothetical protein
MVAVWIDACQNKGIKKLAVGARVEQAGYACYPFIAFHTCCSVSIAALTCGLVCIRAR